MSELIVGGSRRLLKLADSLDWLAPLLLRLVFGYFWLETGWYKLHNIEGATQRFIEWGIPFPAFSAPFSAATELLGGALIMLGLFTRLTAIPMAINMVVAIALVQFANLQDFNEFVELDEVLYILVFFWLAIAGPGRASLDHLLRRRLGI
jgi:putative oxidoreductase